MAAQGHMLLVVMVTVLSHMTCAEITWDVASVEVTQGDDVTVTCSITELEMFDVAKTELHTGSEVMAISDNEDLKPLFASTGRYHLTVRYEGAGATVTITYKGIRGEDRGSLVCYAMSDTAVKATVPVNVQVPIKSVNLMVVRDGTEMEIAKGETFEMIEGQEMGVICVITMDGADTPPPDVQIKVGGIDVTNKFTRTENMASLSRVTDALPQVSNEIRYSYITFEPNKEFNKKEMICSVDGKLADNDKHGLNLFINVYYMPIVTCRTSEYFAQLEHSTSVRCDVHSNPGATLTYVYSGQDGEYTLREHPKHEQYRTEEKMISEDHTEIHISIHEVHEEHFGRYFIKAVNDYGQGQTEFLLHKGATEEDVEPEPEPPVMPPAEPETEPAASENGVKVDIAEIPPNYVTPKTTRRPKVKTQPVVKPKEPQASRTNSGAKHYVCVSPMVTGLITAYIIAHLSRHT